MRFLVVNTPISLWLVTGVMLVFMMGFDGGLLPNSDEKIMTSFV